MTYPFFLFVHSWLRWAVLLLGMVALVRSGRGWLTRAPWTQADRSLQLIFTIFVDVQLLVGLALYFGVSPIVPRTLEAFREAMRAPAQRFFAVEHVFAMIVALVIIHVSSVLSRRATDDTRKHQRWALGLLFALLVTFAAIPWPSLNHGRPLFRF